MWRVVAVIVVALVVITRGYFWIERTSFSANVDPEGWRNAAKIAIDNRDTTNLYNASLFLLYEPERGAGALPLNIVTKSPNGEQRAEQFDVILDPEMGSDAMLKRKIQHVQYKFDMRWEQMGEYTIYIYPRKESKGIVAAGIKLHRTTDN